MTLEEQMQIIKDAAKKACELPSGPEKSKALDDYYDITVKYPEALLKLGKIDMNTINHDLKLRVLIAELETIIELVDEFRTELNVSLERVTLGGLTANVKELFPNLDRIKTILNEVVNKAEQE